MCGYPPHVAVAREPLDVDANLTIGKREQCQLTAMREIEVQSGGCALATESRFSAGEKAYGHAVRCRHRILTEQHAKCRAGHDESAPILFIAEPGGARALHGIEKIVQRGDIVRGSGEGGAPDVYALH